MIEMIQQRFRQDMAANERLNITREFLQILCLKAMSDKNLFDQLAFVGGTSLRIVFGLKRFSEDLDFSLLERSDLQIGRLEEQLHHAFSLYGLKLETWVKSEGNVQSIMMKFPGLLKELGLSDLERQKLSIKVEIDLNPPQGWQIAHSIVYDVYMFSVTHYDLSSSFATKLHACLYRRYTKGRDLYDFIWYLGRKTLPNFALLNNAILQTQGTNPNINAENLKPFLLEYVRKIDMEKARRDASPFLREPSELRLFDQDILVDAIESTF